MIGRVSHQQWTAANHSHDYYLAIASSSSNVFSIRLTKLVLANSFVNSIIQDVSAVSMIIMD